MVRKFSRKARRYMQGYVHLRSIKKDNDGGDEKVLTFYENEKIHKVYKSHRDACCFDSTFIENVMKECIRSSGSYNNTIPITKRKSTLDIDNVDK